MNKQSFILGNLNLHNELLSFVIREKLKIKCHIMDDVELVFSNEVNNLATITLIMIDSTMVSFENVLRAVVTKGKAPETSYIVAIFNLHRHSGIEQKALQKKIKGFFYRHDSLDILSKGIQALFKGEIWISRDILLKCALDGFEQKTSIIKEKNELTQREIEILSLVSLGATNEEIATKTFISPHTVKTHLYKIYKKITVTNRLQAAIWASENL